jgi:antitoxin PrlF
MPVSTLTSKYQATIPRAVRDALTLGAGDRIEFIIERDGVRVRRALPADAELQELEATLAPEWDSVRDDAAYADL